MDETRIKSLEQLRLALLEEQDPYKAMLGATTFLRISVEDRDQEVKIFLMQIIDHFRLLEQGKSVVGRAIRWLGDYKDESLLPVFINLARDVDKTKKGAALDALRHYKGPQVAATLAEVLQEEGLSARDVESLLFQLASTGEVDYLDVIAGYLEASSVIIKIGAITSLLRLGSMTDRSYHFTLINQHYREQPEARVG